MNRAIRHLELQVDEARVKKLQQIDLRFIDTKDFTPEEYIAYLKSILKDATLMLARRLARNELKDAPTLLNITERVHWLIDSAGKSVNGVDSKAINIVWQTPEEASSNKEMQVSN